MIDLTVLTTLTDNIAMKTSSLDHAHRQHCDEDLAILTTLTDNIAMKTSSLEHTHEEHSDEDLLVLTTLTDNTATEKVIHSVFQSVVIW